MCVPFWYNKQSILKACRFSVRKSANSLFWRKLIILVIGRQLKRNVGCSGLSSPCLMMIFPGLTHPESDQCSLLFSHYAEI